MGKPKFASLSAPGSRPEAKDSWMRDLQLQTVEVDPARWSQAAQPALWDRFRPRARVLRLH
jgi:hypothetical protein